MASGCAAPPLPDPAVLAGAWQRHLDPVHGVALRMPPQWTLQDAETQRYGGPDGWLRVRDWTGPESNAADAAEAYARQFGFPGASVEAVKTAELDLRLVTPRWPANERAWVFASHPAPIKRTFSERTASCVMIECTRPFQRALAASLRFERSPAAYLDGGLELMRRYSFKRAAVDWAAVRDVALEAAGPLGALKDAHVGLAAALGVIADRHSFMLPPRETEQFFAPGATGTGYVAEQLDERRVVVRVYADSPAAAAGVHVGDVVERHEAGGAPGAERLTLVRPGVAAPFTVELVPGNYATTLLPEYRPIAPGVAYLELPDTVANSNYDPYRRRLAELVARADAEGARAWILDVRRNSGGSHWAMIAPIAALIGEGPFGGTENADGARALYSVIGGRVHEDRVAIDPDLVPGPLARPEPPVAVLASRLSASAAEAVVLAFVGRPRARRFGEPTLGVPTSNTAFELWDGAFLNLASYKGLDRLGQAWDGPIPPDEQAATRWEAFGTPEDPCVAAALGWLAAQ